MWEHKDIVVTFSQIRETLKTYEEDNWELAGMSSVDSLNFILIFKRRKLSNKSLNSIPSKNPENYQMRYKFPPQREGLRVNL